MGHKNPHITNQCWRIDCISVSLEKIVVSSMMRCGWEKKINITDILEACFHIKRERMKTKKNKMRERT